MKVSIIMPVYNPGRFLLSRAIESVLGQTFDNLELICVDDGSTDGSSEILHDYARKDARVKIITQKNCGAIAARSRGLSESKGEYIYWCDHDDAMHPELLSITMAMMERHDVEAVFIGARIISTESQALEGFRPLEVSYKQIITDNPFAYLRPHQGVCINLPPWGYIGKRSVFLKIESEHKKFRNAQFGYLIRLFSAFSPAVITDAPLYYYSSFNSSMSRSAVSYEVINDFRNSLLDAAEFCLANRDRFNKQQQKSIAKQIFARNLKYQWNWIRRSKQHLIKTDFDELKLEFQKELLELSALGFLPWTHCKVRHVLSYLLLMKGFL